MKIVILPGLDGTGLLVGAFAGLLKGNHEPLVLGYPTDMSRYADLSVWVEERLPNEDFVIVAESFAGPLAVLLAGRRPTGLRGIVFVATFAASPRRLPQALSQLVNFLPLSFRPISLMVQPFLMGMWGSRTFTDLFQRAVATVPKATFAHRLREVLGVDVRVKLRAITVRTMYLSPSKDRLVPASAARAFQQHGSLVVEVDGPHFLMQANPVQTAQLVANFVGTLQ